MGTFPIVKEGFVYIGSLLLITALVAAVNPHWSLFPAFLTLFLGFFFRNPNRKSPKDTSSILSPADGRVMSIVEVNDDEFVNEPGTKVSIFLSVFDVHVNRSPVEGEIKYQQYICGRYRPAYKEAAAWENERHSIGIESVHGRVLVTQIAGILARRIVSWVTLGAQLEKGQRYGMIKFGSCTELTVPKNVVIEVKKGDRVVGGISVIGRIAN